MARQVKSKAEKARAFAKFYDKMEFTDMSKEEFINEMQDVHDPKKMMDGRDRDGSTLTGGRLQGQRWNKRR